jgi:hypothetical protein
MKRWDILCVAVLGACAAGQAQENYAQWSGLRTYYLNTAATGANVAGTVRNFPLLVRLGAADSATFTAAKAGGADLRFTRANGARLQHQIERWNAAGREAAVWVRVDTILGNTANQVLRMYWGKSDAADSSKSTAVFDTAQGFVAVWHMTGSGNDTDATSHKIPAVAVADSIPTAAAGLIGAGRGFNGSAHHFTVAHQDRLAITSEITLSTWLNATNWTGSARILQKGIGTSNNSGQYGFRDNSSDNFAIEINGSHAATAPSPSAGTWHLIHGTYDGATVTNYQDGVAVASATNVSGAIVTGTDAIKIGRSPVQGTPNFFSGTLDELRLQKVARSADWVRLEFESQKPDPTLVQRVPVVAIQGAARPLSAGTGILARANRLTFDLPAGEGTAVLSVTDMAGRQVWNRAVALDGQAVSIAGPRLRSGVYVARIALRDAAARESIVQRTVNLSR